MFLKPNLSCNADHKNLESIFITPDKVAASTSVWSSKISATIILYTFAMYNAWNDPRVDMSAICQNLLVLIATFHGI